MLLFIFIYINIICLKFSLTTNLMIMYLLSQTHTTYIKFYICHINGATLYKFCNLLFCNNMSKLLAILKLMYYLHRLVLWDLMGSNVSYYYLEKVRTFSISSWEERGTERHNCWAGFRHIRYSGPWLNDSHLMSFL